MGSNLGVLTSTMKSPWLLWQLLSDQQIAANNIWSGILIGFLALGKAAKFSLQTLRTNLKVINFLWSAQLFSWIPIFSAKVFFFNQNIQKITNFFFIKQHEIFHGKKNNGFVKTKWADDWSAKSKETIVSKTTEANKSLQTDANGAH